MEHTTGWSPATMLSTPLFAPLAPLLSRFTGQELPSLAQCNALLEDHAPPICVQRGIPVRFVPQALGKPPLERQFEPRCYLTGEVQMRPNNLHDALNALVWMTFPASKAAINSRHYIALEDTQAGTTGKRGSARDMVTLFDESGVIVACADPDLASLLQNRQWMELFWQRRNLVMQRMDFLIFGHGLYEKSLNPYIGMTGKGIILMTDRAFFSLPLKHKLARLDHSLADYLNNPRHCQTTRELLPVPLLGIPGWDKANHSASFYRNTAYFRALTK